MNSYKTQNPSTSLLLLQSHLNPLNLHTSPFHSQPQEPTNSTNPRPQILKEESIIEQEIIKTITTGKPESLKPNSGQAVPIGEHYVCVSFHEEDESDCRVWEWHGHVVIYTEESGYTQEYVYGNYFERIMRKVLVEESDEEAQDRGLGLRNLICGLNLTNGRVVRRNLNASSSRS